MVFKPLEGEEKTDLNVDAKLFPMAEGSQEFRIWMEVEVKVQDCWEIKVSGFGDFELLSDLADIRKFINVNAPAIMFPYFRSFISTLTANTGGSVPLITIPPRFFKGELEEVKIESEE